MNIPPHILKKYKEFTYVDNLIRCYNSNRVSIDFFDNLNDFLILQEFDKSLPINSTEYSEFSQKFENAKVLVELQQYKFIRQFRYLDLMCKVSNSQLHSYRLFNKKYAKLPHLVTRCNTKIRCNQKKTANIRRRMESIFWDIDTDKKENVYFVTFTFSNDTLENTSAMTRHTYIARYCKKYSVEYVANIDFGGMFGREHYHAVMILNPNSAEQLKKEYSSQLGFINLEEIRSEDDSVKVAKYINKLVNHSVKSTADRIIYSRFKKI